MDKCNKCGITFLGEEIPEGLLKGNPDFYQDMSRTELEKAASSYGWTKENKLKFKINCVYVKCLDRGIKFIRCKSCGYEH